MDLITVRLNGSVDLRIGYDHERGLIEVATLIGFRVDEEALGAAFHVNLCHS